MSFKKLFRKNTLSYKQGDKFFTYNDNEQVKFPEIKNITTKTTAKFENSVYLQRELAVELELSQGGLRLSANTKDIEQFKLLRELVDEIKKFNNIQNSETPLNLESKPNRWNYLWVIAILFGINGLSEMFFHLSFLSHTQPFEAISLLLGMMLGIWIVTSPIYFLIYKRNERKVEQENDFLAGKASSVRDIDFTNIILVGLVGVLIYMLYIKFLVK